MRFRPFARFALAVVALGACPWALSDSRDAAAQDPTDAAVDAVVRNAMLAHQIPGLSLGIIRDGRLVRAAGYGWANVELDVPVSPKSIFQSGSVAKQFTATAIMMLVTEKKLGLDEPISRYLPQAKAAAWGGATVRQLLTHTAGIPDTFGETDATTYTKGILDWRRDYTEEELLRRYITLKLDFAPGEKWNYSNTGYEILGFLIRRVTGEFYGDFLQHRVFGPLSMTATRIISEDDIVPDRVSGYRIVGGKLKNQEWIAPTLNTTADGGLYFNVLDLAKWDAALYTEKLLPRAALEQMWTPVRLNSGKRYPYGFGWDVEEINGHPLIRHGGSNQGFTISMSRYVKDRLTIVVLTNLDSTHSDPEKISEAVAAIYIPALKHPARGKGA